MRCSLKIVAVSVLLACCTRAGKAANLDLTVSTNLCAVDRTYTYNLGPTGMRGWIYRAWPVIPRQDATTAFAPFQILVTHVGTNTPAWGVLATNDVIVGVNGTLFTNDARVSFGNAITEAEKTAANKLSIVRWRAGVTSTVVLTLPMMGTYSATTPYNCPKTVRIMTQAAESMKKRIAARGWQDSGSDAISALALLSVGNPDDLPMLQAYARSIAPATLDLEKIGGTSAWECYKSIFLSEYYMLTGDAEVFHGLSEYVIYAATHQSMFGTAGHGFSNIPPPSGWVAGGTHGSMSWYGPVNQAGLVAQLSIVLGKKAGVVSPEIDPAIGRAAKFFSYYVNRGSVPYGEHEPYFGETSMNGRNYYEHRSNGKDGLAAVLFACMGNKPVQTEFYTRMTVAGYTGEQYGHTGQGFSYLWTTLGANVGGTNAVSEYLKQVLWYRDLTRRCDGSFVYDGGEQFGSSPAADYWTYTSYYDNPTAYYLLHAAIPLKKLFITGKKADPSYRLSPQVVRHAIEASIFGTLCGGYTTNRLVAALGDWDPIVRFNAAAELGARTNGAALIPLLTVMAENPTNASQREAACTTLGLLKASSAVPALTRRLKDPDIWVRAKAAKALTALGSAAAPAVTDMLAAFVANVAPTYPFEAGFNWDDPLQISNGYLSETLFNKLGDYTVKADRSLLYPAVRAGIKQPAGMWRAKLDGFVQDRLTLEDVKALMPELLEDAHLEGPCDRMFTVTPPAAAMNVLAKYRIQEGIEVCFGHVAYWGSIMGATAINRLAQYGEAARWTLPHLYTDREAWVHDNNYNTLVANIAVLEAATNSPAMLSGLAVADPQVGVTLVGMVKALTLTGSSCRTNVLSYAIATQPEHGTLKVKAANVTYTPEKNYRGVDRFTFTTSDGLTRSATATVHIVVGIYGGGLKGQYFDNMDFTAQKAAMFNGTVNFDWGLAAPTNTMAADTYSVRWTGQVLAPESGAFRFSTRTSDGVRLWVNNTLVINDWNDQATNLWNDSTPVELIAGQKYNLKMEYYHKTGFATAKLFWYIPSRQAATIIPGELLFPASGVSLTMPLTGARFGLPAGLPATISLTADASDAGGAIAQVAFYNNDKLIGTDTTAPYSAVWSNVKAGSYTVSARATTAKGEVCQSAVATITVDANTVPVTAGLACWYETGAGVIADRDGVIQAWRDQSGNAHHAVLASGAPVLVPKQLNAKPAAKFRAHSTCFDIDGMFFTKEQYIVVRSPNEAWSGAGSFLGRKHNGISSARESSYNLFNGQTGFWEDKLPAAVSKNGTAIKSDKGSMPRGGYQLGSITNFMVLKITVQGTVPDSYYQIGQNDNLGSSEWDLAEIIGYTNTLSAADEALVGSYLAAKYGIKTVYPGPANSKK